MRRRFVEISALLRERRFQTDAAAVTLLRPKLEAELDLAWRFQLMNQGDFAQALMDSLRPLLSPPADRVNVFGVAAAVAECVASCGGGEGVSSAMRRAEPGETGLDVFSLRFRFSREVEWLCTPRETFARGYQALFATLWKIARARAALDEVWLDQQREENEETRSSTSSSSASSFLHLRAEMAAFLCTLHSYVVLEALATSKEVLAVELANAHTAQLLTLAHLGFLRRACAKAFVTDDRGGGSGSEDHYYYSPNLSRISQSPIAAVAGGDVTPRERRGIRVRLDLLIELVFGFCGLHRRAASTSAPPSSSRVSAVAREFRGGMIDLLDALKACASDDLRTLAAKLDYNEFYSRGGGEDDRRRDEDGDG